MDLDKRGVVAEYDVKPQVLRVSVACVSACKLAQGIWDNVLFTWLMTNVKFELLKKLRDFHKPQIEPHGRGGGCDWRLLKNVNYGRVICLNDHVWFRQLDYVSYFLHHPHKAGDLELRRPVVLLRGGEEPRKKEDWLDDVGGRPTSFRDGFTRGSVKNYSSKAKLLESIQVYPKDFLWVVMHQCGGSTQGFLNTQEGSELLGGGRLEFCFGGVSSTLLATEQCLLEERSFEGLKRRRKLSVKVNVVPQIARQA